MIAAIRVRMFVRLIERKVGLCQTQIWLTRFVRMRAPIYPYNFEVASKFVQVSGVNYTYVFMPPH